MNRLLIRVAETEDLAAIRRVSLSAFTPVAHALGYRPSPMTADYRDAVEARFGFVAVLETEGETKGGGGLDLGSSNIVGFAVTRPRPSGMTPPGVLLERVRGGETRDERLDRAIRRDGALYVEALAVSAGAQRRGVGRALMEAVESLAVGLSLPRVQLHTDPRLAQAKKFYVSRGYVASLRPETGIGPGARTLYSKRLSTLLQQKLASGASALRRS